MGAKFTVSGAIFWTQVKKNSFTLYSAHNPGKQKESFLVR